MKKSTHKHLVSRPREEVFLLSLSHSDLIVLRYACVCKFKLSVTSLDKEMYGNLIKKLNSLFH